MIHTSILNWHDPGSALVHSSFALTVEKFIHSDESFKSKNQNVSSSRWVTHGIKADKKRKLKLKISNA